MRSRVRNEKEGVKEGVFEYANESQSEEYEIRDRLAALTSCRITTAGMFSIFRA
jgi:hypothetical protein